MNKVLHLIVLSFVIVVTVDADIISDSLKSIPEKEKLLTSVKPTPVPTNVTTLSVLVVNVTQAQDSLIINKSFMSQNTSEYFDILHESESLESDFLTWLGNEANCPTEQGVIFYKGECFRLLHNSACEDRQWLVLTSDGKPECVARPCPLQQLLFNGNCVDIFNNSVCSSLEILYIEFTGEVYCDCMPGLIFDNSTMKCVDENRQGFCPNGKVMKIESDQVICVRNKCPTDDMMYNPVDKHCYKKNFEGPCEGIGFSLRFNTTNKIVNCIASRNIFEVPTLQNSCPPGSKRDILGQCQKSFRSISDSPLSLRVTAEHITGFSCPKPYIQLPNGACKKYI